MEKFLGLPEEKQNIVINAAFKAFAANGYKKTSASDIASAAGISKAMIFHYFGTKKALYLYLINFSGNLIMNEINEKFDSTINDFFEKIKISVNIKVSVLKKYPKLTAFLTKVYFEEDEEVKNDINNILAKGEDFRNGILLEGIDYSKFKESVDIKILMKMFSLIADGYAKQLSEKEEIDIDAILKEFEECMKLLKNNFYKEEYL